MTRTICILNIGDEAQHLAAFLRQQSGHVEIPIGRTQADLDKIIDQTSGRVRLISFVSDLIIPRGSLDALVLTPYNIHPGPPEYPGSHPESWAIWEGARSYGVTAHEITPRVDAGAIVATSRFDMPEAPERLTLNEMIFSEAVKVFAVVGIHCVRSDDDLPHMPITWSGRKRTKKDFARLCHQFDQVAIKDRDRLAAACGPDLIQSAA